MVLSSFFGLYAQEVRVSATLDSANYLVGDWMRLQLSVEHPYNIHVLWNYPVMINAENFEKISESGIDSIQQNDFLIENKIVTITTFDTGVLVIPPIECYFQRNGETDTAVTAPLSVYISIVAVDTLASFRPIKPPFTIAMADRKWWLYGIPIITLLLIGGGYWYYLKEKRGKVKPIIQEHVDLRLPHEKALDRINELEHTKPWEQNQVKEYYVELTKILREYIETGLHLPALENTTKEIIAELREKSMDENLLRQLHNDLSMADLVKFAKVQPAAAHHLHILETAKVFVEKTKPVTATEPVKEELSA